MAKTPVAPPRAGVMSPVLIAGSASVVVALPLFLVGGQAVQIGAELGLGVGGLGLVVAFYAGCTAIFAAILGHAVQRLGIRHGLILALVSSGGGMLAAAVAHSTAQLALALSLAGLANGAMHPSANGLLAASAVKTPLGMSLGIKQAAPPAASIAAGLAVPLVALTVGWRWSFGGGALFALLVAFVTARAVPRIEAVPDRREPSSRLARRRSLVILAVAAACGSWAGSSIGVFLVDFGVTTVHLGEGAAGIVLAAASLGTVLGTLASGWSADRPWSLDARIVTAVSMAIGSLGYLLIASAEQYAYVAGAVIAAGLGWAWPPLLHFAVVRAHPGAAARATGVLMTGVAAGSALGPLVLGQVAEHLGYRPIWLLMAAASCAGGALLWVTLRQSPVARSTVVGVPETT